MGKDDILLIWVYPTLRKVHLTRNCYSISEGCKNGAIFQGTPSASVCSEEREVNSNDGWKLHGGGGLHVSS